MKLVVGLGNPGLEYENTRHNMGFRLLDMLANDVQAGEFKKGFKGEYVKAEIEGQSFYMLKPLTYMNLSGTSVKEFASYFKIPTEDIIVLCDDLALEPGRFRLRASGSSGGQKGLGNIIDLMGTEAIKRIRIGTGEPADRSIVDYVLSAPTPEEEERISPALDQALMALKYYLASDDFERAMSKFGTNKPVELNGSK
ncbi:MAG: aminoacyl-tRNA hydrolase [Bacilli bacterium]|jgi:PTH1 family peptidyl-tRNA hydrolase|nr:aminoacyl-tRNA hydrolase [Bacilli bacterium]